MSVLERVKAVEEVTQGISTEVDEIQARLQLIELILGAIAHATRQDIELQQRLLLTFDRVAEQAR